MRQILEISKWTRTPRLLDVMRQKIRARHFSLRNEKGLRPLGNDLPSRKRATDAATQASEWWVLVSCYTSLWVLR